MFMLQHSLFNARYQCSKLTKNTRDDFTTYGEILNRKCQCFQFSTFTGDNFKRFTFICGLQTRNDAALQLKLLNKLKLIAKIIEESNHLRNLKHDTEMVQQSAKVSLLENDKVSMKRNSENDPIVSQHGRTADSVLTQSQNASLTLWSMTLHSRFCPYRSHLCTKHGGKKHKEGFYPPTKAFSYSKKVSMQQKYWRRLPKPLPRISSTYELASVTSNMYRRYFSVNLVKNAITFQIDSRLELTIISSQKWKRIDSPQASSKN
ncbi:Gag-pol polyprotein [Trichuris trichiura]|uniref:Gag-pol polyprotein n=1 Tax=Trichuris trichiura TaxID=36087 RepID=A0A077ZJ05_TRITR|nr:Gag-pol polyprotein [Trichuris trichiura]